MLETLDSIDWATIHHSHGTAEQFPDWLRELAADDASAWLLEGDEGEEEQEQESAFSNIMEYSSHQGSIYEVTPVVTPFIIELLRDMPQHAPRLLLLLGFYAHGYPIFSENTNPTIKKHYEERGEDFSQKIEAAKGWVTSIRQTLKQNLSLFTPYLGAPEAPTRLHAALLLNVFKDDPQVAELFANRLNVETNNAVREALTEDDSTDLDY